MDKTMITMAYNNNRDGGVVNHEYYLGRPLPPPPSGYEWERTDEKEWHLKRIEEPAGGGGSEQQQSVVQGSVIEHVILPGDTFQGLCLRYRVSAVELRRWNNISGSNLKFLSVIKIPVDHAQPVVLQDRDTPDVMLERFKTRTHETTSEAIFYLSQHGWNLDLALRQWTEDTRWCAEVDHNPNFGDFVPEDDEDDEEKEMKDSGKSGKSGKEGRPRRWTVAGICSRDSANGAAATSSNKSGSGSGRLSSSGRAAPSRSHTVTPERPALNSMVGDGDDCAAPTFTAGDQPRRNSDGSEPSPARKGVISKVGDTLFSLFQRKRSLSSSGSGGAGAGANAGNNGSGSGSSLLSSTGVVWGATPDPFREPLIGRVSGKAGSPADAPRAAAGGVFVPPPPPPPALLLR